MAYVEAQPALRSGSYEAGSTSEADRRLCTHDGASFPYWARTSLPPVDQARACDGRAATIIGTRGSDEVEGHAES
jgi:hypothetical protein